MARLAIARGLSYHPNLLVLNKTLFSVNNKIR